MEFEHYRSDDGLVLDQQAYREPEGGLALALQLDCQREIDSGLRAMLPGPERARRLALRGGWTLAANLAVGFVMSLFCGIGDVGASRPFL
jgi:hypothetical protein